MVTVTLPKHGEAWTKYQKQQQQKAQDGKPPMTKRLEEVIEKMKQLIEAWAATPEGMQAAEALRKR